MGANNARIDEIFSIFGDPSIFEAFFKEGGQATDGR